MKGLTTMTQTAVGLLEQIAAEVAIRDMAVRYSVAVDDCDLPSVVSSFTESGVFERAGQQIQGHDQLRSFFAGMMERYALTRHLVEMHTVDPLEVHDRASGMVHGSAQLVLENTAYVAAFRYRDQYEREDGRWRFAKRQLRFIYYLPATELFDGIVAEDRVRMPGTEPQPSEHLD